MHPLIARQHSKTQQKKNHPRKEVKAGGLIQSSRQWSFEFEKKLLELTIVLISLCCSSYTSSEPNYIDTADSCSNVKKK